MTWNEKQLERLIGKMLCQTKVLWGWSVLGIVPESKFLIGIVNDELHATVNLDTRTMNDMLREHKSQGGVACAVFLGEYILSRIEGRATDNHRAEKQLSEFAAIDRQICALDKKPGFTKKVLKALGKQFPDVLEKVGLLKA